jgi:Mechanosensitive ion channel, conserved TM helix
MALAGSLQSVKFAKEGNMWDQVKQALDQSTTGFVTRLASLLPGFVALILALLVSLLAAWIVGIVVRRLLASMRFDERLAQWGLSSIAEWSPRKSPALLVSGAVACTIIATGMLIGIAAFNSDMTSSFVRSVFAYVPNMMGAILVLLVGSVVARFLARTVLIGAVNLNLGFARLLSEGTKWLVMVLAIAMALVHLKIAVGIVELAFGILFGGIVFSLALAVGLGSKELVSKSLGKDPSEPPPASIEEPFRHL